MSKSLMSSASELLPLSGTKIISKTYDAVSVRYFFFKRKGGGLKNLYIVFLFEVERWNLI